MTQTDKGQMKDVHICMSSEAYDQLTKADDELYFVPDECMTEDEADAKYATLTALAGKQNALTAGANITISDNVISASGGGEQWAELPSSEWTSHVFNVGDRVRFTIFSKIFPSVTATDWSTAPTISNSVSWGHVTKVIETEVERVTGDVFRYFDNGTPANIVNYVSLYEYSVSLSNGVMTGDSWIDVHAFNAGGCAFRKIQKTGYSNYIKRIEYIPVSTS